MVIIVSVFLLGLIIFKCFQNEYIYNNTLGRIAITYENISKKGTYAQHVDVIKTNKSYTSLDEANFIHWDVKFFKYMAENSYGKDDTWPGLGTYAFSSFPFYMEIISFAGKIYWDFKLFAVCNIHINPF